MKVFMGVLVSFVLVFIAILILPFVIDLSRFKPQIQQAVSKQLNVNIDFESIQLTIFSGLGFKLENVSLVNTDVHFQNVKLLQVKEIKFQTQVVPLFSGKIIGFVEIDSPNIKIVKEGDVNNISSLIKTTQSNAPSVEAPVAPAGGNADAVKSPDIEIAKKQDDGNFVKNILIESFKINNAYISYLDKQSKKNPILIQKLNLDVSNIGVDKDVKVIFSTDLNIKDDDYTVKGPLSLKIVAKTALEATKWKNSTFKGDLYLNELNINYKNIFVKSDKIPFHFDFEGKATPELLVLNNFSLNLQSLDLQAQVNIQDFKKLKSDIHFNLSSKNVTSLGEILPQYKTLLTKGTFNLDSSVGGLLSDTNTIHSSSKLSANLYQSDIRLQLDETSIKPLQMRVQAQSNDLNVGEIVKPLMAAPSRKKEKSDFEIQYDNLKFHNFSLDTSLDGNVLSVKDFGLDIFNGNMASNFIVHLNENPLSYLGNIKFKHIQIQDLIKLVKFKEQTPPLEGVTDLTMSFNGQGTSQEAISKTLNANGAYAFSSGKLNMKSIMGLASEQLGKYTSSINIPGLDLGLSKINSIDLGQNKQKSLKNVKGNFEIKNGKIIVDNNITSDQGNIKLNATVGFDESLGGTAVYTSTKMVNNQLKALNKNFIYFFDSKGNLQLNLVLGGTISNPEVKIEAKNLQDNIMKNTTKALRDKLKDEIKEQLKNNPHAKKLEEGAKKLLKDKLDLKQFGF